MNEVIETELLRKIEDVTVNIEKRPQFANALEIIVDNITINTLYESIEISIDFQGDEKVCWDCGRDRSLGIITGFKRKYGYMWYEFCKGELPEKISMLLEGEKP